MLQFLQSLIWPLFFFVLYWMNRDKFSAILDALTGILNAVKERGGKLGLKGLEIPSPFPEIEVPPEEREREEQK